MLRLLTFLLAVMLAAELHAEPKVRYALATCQPGASTAITKVADGGQFDLVMFVQDLRPSGTFVSPIDGQTKNLLRGVWSAYADVTYSKAAATIVVPSGKTFVEAFTFKPPYNNGPQAIDLPDRIGSLGAFDGFNAIGSRMLEVARVRMTAHFPPTAHGATASTTFGLDFSKLDRPAYDTLLLGNLAANPPEQSEVAMSEILTSGCTLTITR